MALESWAGIAWIALTRLSYSLRLFFLQMFSPGKEIQTSRLFLSRSGLALTSMPTHLVADQFTSNCYGDTHETPEGRVYSGLEG